MSSIHIVRAGETIWDVCLNECGTLTNDSGPLGNLDDILEANNMADWTFPLTAGQEIIIPDTVQIDANVQRQIAASPLSNNANNAVYAQIDDIFDILANNWILEDGTWNGNAIWTVDGIWNTV